MIPVVIQRANCFFCFNVILATGKHLSYSFTLLNFFISRNLKWNVSIDWSKNLRLHRSSFLACSFLALKKETGKRSEMTVFIILDLKPVSIKEFVMIWSIALAIYLVTHAGLLIAGIIQKQNIRFIKLWFFWFASKSGK